MEDKRDKLVDDLNSILKDNFDYVPLYKVRNIVDELIEEGWKFDYEILETMVDDGKHSIADGEYPKPNVLLKIYCAENKDDVGGGVATYGTDRKWYWTYNKRIDEECKYTVTHWRYL